MESIRVILADDHTFLRLGLRALLEDAPGIEIVAEAGDGEEALDLVANLRPDVLVTDINMPRLDGLKLASRVSADHPATRVLILSMYADREFARKALSSGAAGYLVKDAGEAELEAAIRAVARGESYLSPTISAHLVKEFSRLARAETTKPNPLTARQVEVLKLVAEGMTTKAIARCLGVSIKTVDTHRTQLMDRLGIHDVAGLVRYALRQGFIKSEE
ncbi:Transcriptional regulatory protein DegU [Aquisphaera giovannonii]|uniref:Transcriptional regulatory protein DegU n=1 Tax=Aquisphaera giovannonii TaxID=406548 RepID=A0A5B9VY23_9BACT|nr:response regulator transcription factor [Aquisphaera giovannonii]QEH32934.1 Transcriptional regulatory protein DegU [Aquisphaera giovannonii]